MFKKIYIQINIIIIFDHSSLDSEWSVNNDCQVENLNLTICTWKSSSVSGQMIVIVSVEFDMVLERGTWLRHVFTTFRTAWGPFKDTRTKLLFRALYVTDGEWRKWPELSLLKLDDYIVSIIIWENPRYY